MGSPKLRTLTWPLHSPPLLWALKALDCVRGVGVEGGQEKEAEEPSQGAGRACWGCGRIISQTRGLALSPLWLKKQLMRPQALEIQSGIPTSLTFPSCITAIGPGRRWDPGQPFYPLASLLSAEVPSKRDKTVQGRECHGHTNSASFHTTFSHTGNQGSNQNPWSTLKD